MRWLVLLPLFFLAACAPSDGAISAAEDRPAERAPLAPGTVRAEGTVLSCQAEAPRTRCRVKLDGALARGAGVYLTAGSTITVEVQASDSALVQPGARLRWLLMQSGQSTTSAAPAWTALSAR
jgi:hypothetical protein